MNAPKCLKFQCKHAYRIDNDCTSQCDEEVNECSLCAFEPCGNEKELEDTER